MKALVPVVALNGLASSAASAIREPFAEEPISSTYRTGMSPERPHRLQTIYCFIDDLTNREDSGICQGLREGDYYIQIQEAADGSAWADLVPRWVEYLDRQGFEPGRNLYVSLTFKEEPDKIFVGSFIHTEGGFKISTGAGQTTKKFCIRDLEKAQRLLSVMGAAQEGASRLYRTTAEQFRKSS